MEIEGLTDRIRSQPFQIANIEVLVFSTFRKFHAQFHAFLLFGRSAEFSDPSMCDDPRLAGLADLPCSSPCCATHLDEFVRDRAHLQKSYWNTAAEFSRLGQMTRRLSYCNSGRALSVAVGLLKSGGNRSSGP